MQNLYQQLLYNWERGFYSVVKDAEGYFSIVSMKPGEDYGVYGTWFKRSVSDCKDMVGNPNVTSFIGYKDADQYTVVDTIHPSELMGKGFQVGDRVKFKDMLGTDCEGTVTSVDEHGIHIGNSYFGCPADNLKPVLPVEEEKITVTHKSHICGCRVWDCESRSSGAKWFFANGSNEWIELMPNVEYAICSKCMKKINQCDVDAAVKLLKEKGIIKDGHIVNL